MNKKVIIQFAALAMLATPVLGQETPQTPVYNCDYQPSCEVAPGMYGAMTSPVKSKFDLAIGGYVKLDYAYNSVNLGPNGGLLPGPGVPPNNGGQIPKTTTNAGKEDQSILTARQSRFWLKAAGPTFLGAKTGALIEADFYGGGGADNQMSNLRMRHAYGTLDWANTQLLFGQTDELFGKMIANVVDFRCGASTGNPGQPRVPQLRLTQKVNLNADNSLKLVFGVQNPTQDSNNNAGNATDTYGSVPNLAGQVMFISKALGVAPGYYGLAMNSLTLGAFGLYGSEKVGVAGTVGNNRAIDSYGYGIYAFVPILKSSNGKSRAMTMSLEAQAYMACNMAFNGATGNLTANGVAGTTTTQGTLTGAKGYGLAGQVIFYPNQDLGITGGYQRRNAYNYGTFAGINNYEKSNTLIYGNIAYDLNAAVRVAAEYENQDTQYGNNSNTAGSTGTAGVGSASGTGVDNTIRLALYYFF